MHTENPNGTLKNYYARRANEYEEIYKRNDPQRQKVDIPGKLTT